MAESLDRRTTLESLSEKAIPEDLRAIECDISRRLIRCKICGVRSHLNFKPGETAYSITVENFKKKHASCLSISFRSMKRARQGQAPLQNLGVELASQDSEQMEVEQFILDERWARLTPQNDLKP